jgi:ParB family chromosome partitioning protein
MTAPKSKKPAAKKQTVTKEPAKKGLEKKEPKKDAGYEIGSIHSLPLSKIEDSPNLLRRGTFKPGYLELLAKSMKDYGYQPVDVYEKEGRIYVSDGFSRTAAARHKNWKELKCYFIPAEKAFENALHKAMMRNDLTAFERAEAFQRLKDETRVIDTQIADLFKRSRTNVSQTLSVLKLPEEIKNAVNGRPFTLTQLIELVNLNEKPEEQQDRFKEIDEKVKRKERDFDSEDSEDGTAPRRAPSKDVSEGEGRKTSFGAFEHGFVNLFTKIDDYFGKITAESKINKKDPPFEQQKTYIWKEFLQIGLKLKQYINLPDDEINNAFDSLIEKIKDEAELEIHRKQGDSVPTEDESAKTPTDPSADPENVAEASDATPEAPEPPKEEA